MIRKWKLGLFLIVLPYCVPMAVADPAAGGETAVSPHVINIPGLEESVSKAIKAGTATPEQYFDAADKAEKADNMMASAYLYRLAADNGHAIAQVRTGDVLYGSGFFEKAAYYFLKAAEQGNADGMYGLAVVVMGNYKETDLKGDLAGNDFVEARKWFAQAAELGHRPSLIKITDAYIGGGLGLDNDALGGPEALSWIKRAADIDYTPAVEALAKAYREGRYGLTADLAQADELDAKARKLKGIKETTKKKARVIR